MYIHQKKVIIKNIIPLLPILTIKNNFWSKLGGECAAKKCSNVRKFSDLKNMYD